MATKVIEEAGPNTKVELGDTVRDSVTGFEGIVNAITVWRFGCRRIAVLSQTLKDGKPHDNEIFDEPALHILKRANVPKVVQAERQARGGPKDARSERAALRR